MASPYQAIWSLTDSFNEQGIQASRDAIREIQGKLYPKQTLQITIADFSQQQGAEHLLYLALGALEHVANEDLNSAALMLLQIAQTTAARIGGLTQEPELSEQIAFFGPAQ